MFYEFYKRKLSDFSVFRRNTMKYTHVINWSFLRLLLVNTSNLRQSEAEGRFEGVGLLRL